MSELSHSIKKEVNAWFAWLPKWKPAVHRGKIRVCKRCTGSPIVVAAGFGPDVPHPVQHSLVSRIHRVIEKEVDNYTRAHLPLLQAELDGAKIWRGRTYNSLEGLPDEVAGIDPDLIFEENDHPVLFTFAELEAEDNQHEVILPQPPLTDEEKSQLRKEMQLADAKATEVGQEACFELLDWRHLVAQGITTFIEPQIQHILDELTKNLDTP